MVNFMLCVFHLNLKKKKLVQPFLPKTDLTPTCVSYPPLTKVFQRLRWKLLAHTQALQRDLASFNGGDHLVPEDRALGL